MQLPWIPQKNMYSNYTNIYKYYIITNKHLVVILANGIEMSTSSLARRGHTVVTDDNLYRSYNNFKIISKDVIYIMNIKSLISINHFEVRKKVISLGLT